jgi:hypothetical protein
MTAAQGHDVALLKAVRMERDALLVENDRLQTSRDKAVALLMADPDRAAVAALEGLRTMLPELKVEEDERIGAILDWIGVAGDDALSLAERVRILAFELATKQGYSLEEAERLCP